MVIVECEQHLREGGKVEMDESDAIYHYLESLEQITSTLRLPRCYSFVDVNNKRCRIVFSPDTRSGVELVRWQKYDLSTVIEHGVKPLKNIRSG